MELTRSDEELMAAYQQGDLAAFEVLYLRYEKRIFGYLLRRTGNRQAAEDLFQEVFLRLHRARNDYQPTLPFATWLFTIASNVVKNELKRLGRARKVFEEKELDFETLQVAERETPEAHFEEQELRERIEQALRALPDSQREVVLLSKFQGFSYPEIAQITGHSVGAVKQLAHRAFMTLKRNIQLIVLF